MSQLILTENKESVFEIKLNRPEKRNAINLEMLAQFDQAVHEAAKSSARAVVIRGAEGLFSAGIDVTTFMQLSPKYGPDWLQQMRRISDDFQAVFTRLERLERPTIAILDGYCLGLALELALACDIRLMSDRCQWGLPETRLGIIPDVGGTTRLTRVVGPSRAKEIIFTGKRYAASFAAHWQVVNYVVAAEQLEQTAQSLVDEIALSAPLAVGMAKRVIDGLSDIDRGLQLEAWAQSQLMATEDFSEAVQSFITKRPANFKGK